MKRRKKLFIISSRRPLLTNIFPVIFYHFHLSGFFCALFLSTLSFGAHTIPFRDFFSVSLRLIIVYAHWSGPKNQIFFSHTRTAACVHVYTPHRRSQTAREKKKSEWRGEKILSRKRIKYRRGIMRSISNRLARFDARNMWWCILCYNIHVIVVFLAGSFYFYTNSCL
jgi:hypothetical protein